MTNTLHIPRVTVLMPVYNGQTYLREAIESILTQTYKDFEFLVIDDGSTDNSVAIIQTYIDPRIRFVKNVSNYGLVATLNRGIDLSQGTYIARMDCDDVSLPTRLEKQVVYMDAHPDVGVCSSWVKIIGDAPLEVWSYPVEPDAIKCRLLFESVIPHPAAILRTKAFKENGLYYDSSFRHVEDYELWVRAVRKMPFANIGEVLLLYRAHQNNVGHLHNDEKTASSLRVRSKQLMELGISYPPEELNIHQSISRWQFRSEKSFVEQVEVWLGKLREANKIAHIYPEPAFSLVLAERWKGACEAATINGFWAWKKLNNTSFKNFLKMSIKMRMIFILKCLCKMGKSK